MKQRISKRIPKTRNLLKDNTGATIITVLVTMTFVIVLASILMYLSLVNLQMKKLDKEGKISFYSAETVMNEIRAGVQHAASEAIKEAYSDVLISYSTASKEEQTVNFKADFLEKLLSYTVRVEGIDRSLLTRSGSDYSYDSRALGGFVSLITDPNPMARVTVEGAGDAQVSYADGAVAAIVLKDIAVTYTSGGYQTSVTADIKIAAPELPYTSTSMKQSKAPDFAIIAGGTLRQYGGEASVTGSVYAGDVTISGAGTTLKVNNAMNFVSAGPITVSGGQMTFGSNSNIWAGEITIGGGGGIQALGDVYIADDLNLLSGARATLWGRYFGFGNLPDADLSSAIIINGKDTRLDMTRLRTLLIAGHSFVNFGTGDAGGYVLMGESVSAKSNQLAYLLPESCLNPGVTNPCEYELIDGAHPDNAYFQSLVNAGSLSQKFGKYGIMSPVDNIQYIRKTVGSKHYIYFCLQFTDTVEASGTVAAREHANRYFADYYGANGPVIKKYLDIYSDGITIPDGIATSLAGNAFTFNEGAVPDEAETAADNDDTLGPLIGATTVPANAIDAIKASYDNLRVTLSRTDTGSEASPYEHFVNTGDIEALVSPGGTETYYTGAEAKAVVANGDYAINGDTPLSVHIVIADGSVTVSRDFSGLIIAKDGVTLSLGVKVSSGRTLVAEALQALVATDDGGDYYMFFNREYMSPLNISGKGTTDAGVWDLNKLVYYENWTKNA